MEVRWISHKLSEHFIEILGGKQTIKPAATQARGPAVSWGDVGQVAAGARTTSTTSTTPPSLSLLLYDGGTSAVHRVAVSITQHLAPSLLPALLYLLIMVRAAASWNVKKVRIVRSCWAPHGGLRHGRGNIIRHIHITFPNNLPLLWGPRLGIIGIRHTGTVRQQNIFEILNYFFWIER